VTATILEHRYRPRGAAAELLKIRDKEVLLSGPAGTGKSRACLEKLHFMCLMNPRMKALAVRKTAVSLTSTGLVTYQEHVAPESIAAGDVVWFGGSKREPAAYRYSNGSRLVVGGMDDPTKIMSSEYDACYVQEAIELTEDDWEKVTTRLRNGRVSFQQLIADTNPDAPHHWLKARADKGLTRMVESRHEDNPMLFDDAGVMTEAGTSYLETLDRLTGVRYYRLRKGLWVAAEGMVYEEWDPAIHLIDRFDIPWDWTRWWVCDFGYTHPLVIQCWAEDPDGRLYLYREIFHTKRTVDQHARDILNAVSTADPAAPDDLRKRVWHEPKPRTIVCDHDAEGRVVLARETGIGTTPAIKKVGAGIQVVQQRLRKAGDGKPRIFIMRDSVVRRDQELLDAKRPSCTAEEIVGYVWAKGARGEVLKEEPVKEMDDGMDCVRYIASHRDLGSPRVRHM
jgi:PBSX family phage terminase large subunit